MNACFLNWRGIELLFDDLIASQKLCFLSENFLSAAICNKT